MSSCHPLGKRTIAEYIALENDYAFFNIEPKDIFGGVHYRGQAQNKLRVIVQQIKDAAKKETIVVLFDRIHDYGRYNRGLEKDNWSQLLRDVFDECYRELEETPNIIVMGRANRCYDASFGWDQADGNKD